MQQPPYPQSNTPQQPPLQNNGWILVAFIITYAISILLIFIESVVQSGVQSDTSTTNILGSLATFLLLVLHGGFFIVDGRNFSTLHGKIHWKQLGKGARVVLVIVYFCIFVMPAIYLVQAVRQYLYLRKQTLGQAVLGWWNGYRAKSSRGQLVIASVCIVFTVLGVAAMASAAMVDRASTLKIATSTSSPVPSPLSTRAITSIATQAPVTPTLIPTTPPISPTVAIAQPTHAPPPTIAPTRSAPTRASGVNGNPWGYTFSGSTLIYLPPSNFCAYFSCIDNFPNGHGYVMECSDGMYSKSGGRRGSCSHHGGNQQPLYAP